MKNRLQRQQIFRVDVYIGPYVQTNLIVILQYIVTLDLYM